MFGTVGMGWFRAKWFDILALSTVIIVLTTALYFDRMAARINSIAKESADRIPKLGGLSGWKTGNGNEWAANSNGIVVVFNVAPKGQYGDLDYWERVASHVKELNAPVQFVGLCSRSGICDEPTLDQSSITYLTAMDPLQMAALALADSRNTALVYRVGSLMSNSSNPTDTEGHGLFSDQPAFIGTLAQEISVTNESQVIFGTLQNFIGELNGGHQ